MLDDLWTRERFEDVTGKRNANRATFKSLDEALDAAHRATALDAQRTQVERLLEQVAQWLERAERLSEKFSERGPPSSLRHRLRTVRQLRTQAEQVLTALSQQQRTQRFEDAAARLARERFQAPAPLAPGAAPDLTQSAGLVRALFTARTPQAREQLLTALSPTQRPWLRDVQVVAALRRALTPGEMSWFSTLAIECMLVPPDGSTLKVMRCLRPTQVRQEVLRLLSPLVIHKDVALNLLRAQVNIAVIPRNKPMTDLPMFASLKDVIVRGGGRVWNSTRGVGNVAHEGKTYLACTEENLLGHDPDVRLSSPYKTNACPAEHTLDHNSPRAYYSVHTHPQLAITYPEGYSTTVHEFAHIVHLKGLSDADRKLIDSHYARWSRGLAPSEVEQRTWTKPQLTPKLEQARSSTLARLPARAAQRLLSKPQRTEAEDEELAELLLRNAQARSPDAPAPKDTLVMGWEWADGPVGLTDAERARREREATARGQFERTLPTTRGTEQRTVFGKTRTVEFVAKAELPAPMREVPPAASPRCYASSHVEEYFAQVTCCWFETNGGEDPYTHKPRHNDQDWVRQNEPRPMVELLERIYGDTTLPGSNPRGTPL